MRCNHRRRLGSFVGLSLATLLLSMSVAPAFAIEKSKVTLSEETGGQPTRFTFVTTTDDDALISSMTFDFPEDFEADERVRVTVLKGIARTPIEATAEVEGGRITVDFNPAIQPGSELRVEAYDVMTPVKGGDYDLAVQYTAETTTTADVSTETRNADPVPFSYVTPSTGEIIASWLDDQEWVSQFNEVKAFGLFFRPQLIVQAIPALFTGWLISIVLVLVAFPIAIAAGLTLAFMKMSKVPPLRWIAAVYVNVIRGTPLFLQIFVAFIGLRIAGVRAPDFATAVAVLAFNSSAYLAEIFRAGIQSIHKGQFEAANSLGMRYGQAMAYVIIPQTVRRVLPTMTSEFILLFKDTALLAAVGIFELMQYAQNMVARNGNLTPFVVAAIYYLIVTIPLINWVGRLEEKLAVAEGGRSASEGRTRRRWLRWRGVAVNEPQSTSASDGEDK